VRLLLDEHLSPRIAVELRGQGFDVIAVAERADLRGRSDDEIIDAASVEARALVTFDVADHVRLAHQATRVGTPHPGLVLLAPSSWAPSAHGVGTLVRALAALLADHPDDRAFANRIEWLADPA
jgi:predicted nuclease of predicted toxin-antitoxin system